LGGAVLVAIKPKCFDFTLQLFDAVLPLPDFESDCAEFAWMVAIGRLR
jgi:hypothetical protein